MKVGENMRIPDPVLNEDFYMVKRIGGDVALPVPRTRFEKLLYIYAGGTIERPIPKTVEERFLDYITGGESELPAPKTRLQSYMYNVANPSNKIPIVPPKTRFECYWFVMAEVNNVISYELPVEFTSVDGFLLDYTIWGNSEQDGTPTPEEPVVVMSVGDRTSNLLDLYSYKTTKGVTLQIASNTIIGSFDSTRDSYIIYQLPITPNQIYTISGEYTSTTYNDRSMVVSVMDSTSGDWYSDNNVARLFRREVTGNHFELSFQSEDNFVSVFIVFTSHEFNQTGTTLFKNLQIQEGAEATEFEPFGYKIPVTVSGENGEETTTVIYLDDPLRKIGDYVDYINFENQQHIKNVLAVNFTGEEEWRVQGNNYFTYIPHRPSGMPPTLCSAFSLSTSGSTAVGEYRLAGIGSWNGNVLFNYDNGADGVVNFKSYLAQQYANGTPVKFYYPTVPAITELIEAPKIPTFSGTNVIDTDTTVKPSKIEVVTRTE